MIELDTRVRKIALPLELDPDFGDLAPENVQGFVLDVLTRKNREYSLILLMPMIECDEELEELISEVLMRFLERRAKYTIRDLDDEDVEIFKDLQIPVLSFHPASLADEKICFYWQIPPRHLMQ